MTFKSFLALAGVAVGALAIISYFRKKKQAEPISICPYTKEPCDFKSCDECQHDYHLSGKVDTSAFLTPDEKLYESDLDWEQATAPDDESECSDISDDEPEYFKTSDDEYEDEAELDWEQATASDDEPEYFDTSDDSTAPHTTAEAYDNEFSDTSDEDEGNTSYFDISDKDENAGTSASDDFYDLDTASDEDEDTGTSASDDFDDIDTASGTGTTDEREIYRHLEMASDEFDSVEEVDTPEYRPEVSAIE